MDEDAHTLLQYAKERFGIPASIGRSKSYTFHPPACVLAAGHILSCNLTSEAMESCFGWEASHMSSLCEEVTATLDDERQGSYSSSDSGEDDSEESKDGAIKTTMQQDNKQLVPTTCATQPTSTMVITHDRILAPTDTPHSDATYVMEAYDAEIGQTHSDRTDSYSMSLLQHMVHHLGRKGGHDTATTTTPTQKGASQATPCLPDVLERIVPLLQTQDEWDADKRDSFLKELVSFWEQVRFAKAHRDALLSCTKKASTSTFHEKFAKAVLWKGVPGWSRFVVCFPTLYESWCASMETPEQSLFYQDLCLSQEMETFRYVNGLLLPDPDYDDPDQEVNTHASATLTWSESYHDTHSLLDRSRQEMELYLERVHTRVEEDYHVAEL